MRPLSFILPWSRRHSRFACRSGSDHFGRKPPHLKGAGFLVLGVVDPGTEKAERAFWALAWVQDNNKKDAAKAQVPGAKELEVGVRHPFLVEAQPLAALCQHLQKKIRATRKTGERVEANMPLDPG